MNDEHKNPTPDAEQRIWAAIDAAKLALTANRLVLGKLCIQLENLYSERAAGVRRSSGHGTFVQELKKRGFNPRTVREWMADFAAYRDGKPTTAEKRQARRQRVRHNASGEFDRGYKQAMHDFPIAASGSGDDPISHFARLLPFGALKAAYRAALQEVHPDHGGSGARTQELIAAWEAVERFHDGFEDAWPEVRAAHVN
jgi:hypothetical protein